MKTWSASKASSAVVAAAEAAAVAAAAKTPASTSCNVLRECYPSPPTGAPTATPVHRRPGRPPWTAGSWGLYH